MSRCASPSSPGFASLLVLCLCFGFGCSGRDLDRTAGGEEILCAELVCDAGEICLDPGAYCDDLSDPENPEYVDPGPSCIQTPTECEGAVDPNACAAELLCEGDEYSSAPGVVTCGPVDSDCF